MNTDVKNRLNEEIIHSINDDVLDSFDKDTVASVIKTIVDSLGDTKFGKNFFIDKFGVTTGENKNGEKLFYVKGSFYKHHNSEAAYYAFNSKGEYVGCVKAFVCNIVPPTQVEMEYWADEEHKNQGNITVLAREVIKDIFENREFDNFHIRDGLPPSNIESISLAINEDNYPSIAVARKLGFDDTNTLNITDYLNQKQNQK